MIGFTKLLKFRETAFQSAKRWVHSRPPTPGSYRNIKSSSVILLAATGLFGSIASYRLYVKYQLRNNFGNVSSVVYAADKKLPESQPSVFTPTKEHALYLSISLMPIADAKKCAKVAANLQKHVDYVCPPESRDEDTELLAGVGFGQEFYTKIRGKSKKNFAYRERNGTLGSMPNTGGDIFIHAKSNSISKLFELCQRITCQFPAGSILKFEDIYSFVYKNGRDLSGFIDGTENPADEVDRQMVAVEPETGGSYVITQKWIHKMDIINQEKDAVLEGFVGRTREDSIELNEKPVSSHVARMTGGVGFQQKKSFEIVRQSMPYGCLHDKAGLFFIAYAASPANFDFMLDRMVGKDKDGHSDDVMKITECVSGNYWYFPGVVELNKLL